MSIMKLMLPPVVSSGQYQMMESSMAMVEHIAMTDKAMIGPQWHSRLTSWMFSNVTIVDRNFIFTNKMTGQFSSWTIWNTRFLLCYLERSSVQAMHMFSLFFCLSCKQTDLDSLGLFVFHCSLRWQTAASLIVNLGHYLCWQIDTLHLCLWTIKIAVTLNPDHNHFLAFFQVLVGFE